MKRSEAFPSKYLSKDDVDPARVGTIDRLTRETLKSDDGDETKTVMYFREEALKPLILNNSNWMTCEDAYGPDSDMWLGKRIELYLDPNVMFGPKRVGGVRVRVPQQPKPDGLPEVWDSARAKEELEKVGLTADDLRRVLKDKGRVNSQGAPAYVAARDTEIVMELVAQNTPAL